MSMNEQIERSRLTDELLYREGKERERVKLRLFIRFHSINIAASMNIKPSVPNKCKFTQASGAHQELPWFVLIIAAMYPDIHNIQRCMICTDKHMPNTCQHTHIVYLLFNTITRNNILHTNK